MEENKSEINISKNIPKENKETIFSINQGREILMSHLVL